MTDKERCDRNRRLLSGCHPVFRHRLATVLARLEADGWRPRIQVAWRSPQDQITAFQNGFSHVRWGFHNAIGADGSPEALAADVLDDDAPLEPRRDYLLALARTARSEGLDTGIDWDLPLNIRTALNAALLRGETWTGKLGWDPTHTQIDGLTIQQARNGERPTDAAVNA